MPAIAVVILLVAAMLAGGGWFLGAYAVKQKHTDVRRGWKLTRVIVAATDLPPGRKLTRDDLMVRDVPEQFATASLFTDPRALVGKTLTAEVSAGTPLHSAALGRICP